jgi:hypothetical protein
MTPTSGIFQTGGEALRYSPYWLGWRALSIPTYWLCHSIRHEKSSVKAGTARICAAGPDRRSTARSALSNIFSFDFLSFAGDDGGFKFDSLSCQTYLHGYLLEPSDFARVTHWVTLGSLTIHDRAPRSFLYLISRFSLLSSFLFPLVSVFSLV